jgi:hypothetical protein
MQQLTHEQIENLKTRRDVLLLVTDFVERSKDYTDEQKLITENYRQELKDFENNDYMIKPLPEFLKLSRVYRLLTANLK